MFLLSHQSEPSTLPSNSMVHEFQRPPNEMGERCLKQSKFRSSGQVCQIFQIGPEFIRIRVNLQTTVETNLGDFNGLVLLWLLFWKWHCFHTGEKSPGRASTRIGSFKCQGRDSEKKKSEEEAAINFSFHFGDIANDICTRKTLFHSSHTLKDAS